ncbi:MAG TPA: 16S rRNA (guanine(966)-N(2))-methyltransferase RsmD, partial [Bacillota bacterium]|nr:16S rRNA (guanine(966)-N(2))-methyltransferase RsmD [Bacillota bacterium]
ESWNKFIGFYVKLWYNNELKVAGGQAVRVITGVARGRKLAAPKGLHTRPTTDRVKEALFNILGERVLEATVLDLFAGSGALAIEALSRGAELAVLVDNDNQAQNAIQQNLSLTGLAGQARLLRQDVWQFLRNRPNDIPRFDIIFLDPPYEKGFEVKAIELLTESDWLAPNGVIIAETSKKTVMPLEVGILRLFRQQKYGDTCLNFYSAADGEAG